MAERHLRTVDFLVLPADKGGRKVLVHRNDLLKMHLELLNSKFYKPSDFTVDAQYWNTSVVPRYMKCVRCVLDADATVSPLDLTYSLKNGLAGLISKFSNTVKDHKPAGQVAFRALHAGGSHSLAGLSAWVAR
eukprot:2751992-Karenia_brevis.AAC.1